jgi:membrane protein implicated in regulation of membrane protease activity
MVKRTSDRTFNEVSRIGGTAIVGTNGRTEIAMPYGLIALIAAILLTAKYVTTQASTWSKVVVVGLVAVSLLWSYGMFVQAAVAAFLSVFFAYQKARRQ